MTIDLNKQTFSYLKISWIVCILIIFVWPIFGQEDDTLIEDTLPIFEIINREDGLSNLSVSSIVEDKYGILWFGTQGGLNRYDGKEITVYKNNPFDDSGLSHNLIQTLTYDEKNHTLWIGTYQGLSRYDIHNKVFKNYTVESHGLSNPVVTKVLIDSEGFVWVATLDGLNRINTENDSLVTYDISGNVVRDLILASDKNMYIASYEGIFIYNKETNQIESTDFILPSPLVMVMNEFSPGILSVGMWDGGISDINLSTKKVDSISLEDNRVYTYIQTRDGSRWIGTWGGGLFAITPNNEIKHFPGSGASGDLNHNVIYALHQNASNILWVGTNGGGIVKINPRKRDYVFLKHNPDVGTSLSAGKVNLIYKDLRENLWIAIYNQGIERYDSQTKSMIKYNKDSGSSIGENVIAALEFDRDHFFIGTTRGLFLYDFVDDTFEPFDIGLEEKIIYALEKDKNILWIGTYHDGVYTYNMDNKKLNHYGHHQSDRSIADNLIYDILVDSQERVWIATNNGLNLIENLQEEIKTFRKISGNFRMLPSNTIRKVFEDSQGKIWIATVGGGLSTYQEETDDFKSYTEAEGLSSNTVLSVLEDDQRNLWLSTLNGLSIINLDDFKIKTLQPEDGIGGFEFNAGHLKDPSGTLYFGGPHGITVIPNTFSAATGQAPKLYISDVEVFQEPQDVPIDFFNDQALNFKTSENMLTFKFLAIDYDAPDKINFYYKLSPMSDNWIPIANRNFISYSNLKPGKYELSVYAETSKGIISDTARLTFTILKPWYLSWYALALYFIIFSALIYIVFKLKESRLLKKANARLETLSSKDPLTNVYNRRYFSDIMDQEFQLAKRSRVSISMLLIDIDNFKDVNDTLGHIAGDDVLIAIGTTINRLIKRNTDFVARYGGDEFVVGLYDTSLEGAIEIANSIQVALKDLPTTLSIGIYTGIPEGDDSINTFIQKADEKLYESKRKGKNIVSHNV